MVKLFGKQYWKDVSCMALQDSIKNKRIEINRNNGLYEVLKNAKFIPTDSKIEKIMSDLISKSSEQERSLRVVARHIKCKINID